jgi:hypothetical protein
MPQSITQAFVQQWHDSIVAQAQQTKSRLMPHVKNRGSITGDGFTINGMEAVELDENVIRHGNTEWGDPNHSARLAVMRDFYKALPLDRNDIPKMMVNPVTGGDYMSALMAGKNRKIDDLIYRAAIDDITSKDGATTYSLPAGQIIANGGTAFTKAKIIQARSIFRANEADEEEGEELCMAYNDQMLIDILSDTTLTSGDYMAVQMIQDGSVAKKWMGFTWVPYQRLDLASTVYSTVAWAKSGIHLGEGYTEGNVTRRGDKKDLWQVSMGASFGAGRQDEKKVVRIDFV